ncbi:MAG: flavin reductase [Bacteroidales bacterium]
MTKSTGFIVILMLFIMGCKTNHETEKQTKKEVLSEKEMDINAKMGKWEKIDPVKIKDNVFKLIGEDWMLVSAGTPEKFNMMTASWGGLGILWNKPVAFIFVRPQRYTYTFLEQQEYYTLTFYEERYREVLQLCGTTSGRNTNKIKESKLSPFFTPNGAPAFEEARIILECKKIYANSLNKNAFIDSEHYKVNYPENDPHKLFIGEIVNVWIKK